MTHTGQMTGSYYGFDGDYSQGDWYNWAYYASVEELTYPRTSIQKVLTSCLRTDRRTKTTGFAFSAHLLVPKSRTRTSGSHDIRAFVRVSVVPVLVRFEQVFN